MIEVAQQYSFPHRERPGDMFEFGIEPNRKTFYWRRTGIDPWPFLVHENGLDAYAVAYNCAMARVENYVEVIKLLWAMRDKYIEKHEETN